LVVPIRRKNVRRPFYFENFENLSAAISREWVKGAVIIKRLWPSKLNIITFVYDLFNDI
jgi:hypothetical protein